MSDVCFSVVKYHNHSPAKGEIPTAHVHRQIAMGMAKALRFHEWNILGPGCRIDAIPMISEAYT